MPTLPEPWGFLSFFFQETASPLCSVLFTPRKLMYLLFDASRLSGLSPAADYPRFYLLSVINVTLSVDIPHKSGSKPLRPPGPNSPFLFFFFYCYFFLPPRFSLSIWSRIITRLLHSCCPNRQTSTRTLVKRKKNNNKGSENPENKSETIQFTAVTLGSETSLLSFWLSLRL